MLLYVYYAIKLIHLLLIMFIIITPFTDSTYFNLMICATLPFIIIHWIMNDNTCCLTIMENYMRQRLYGKSKKKECLTYKLISPIYDFKKNNKRYSQVIYIIAILLLIMSITKLVRKIRNKELTSIYDITI